MKPLPVDDIQGNILLGYRVAAARHFALQIGSPRAARELLASLLPGSAPNEAGVKVSTHADGSQGPHFLTLGFTWEGLRALGLSPAVLDRFPEAFRAGPAARARLLGDWGESGPQRWALGGPSTPAVHLLLSYYFKGDRALSLDENLAALHRAAEPLEALLRKHHLLVTYRRDANALPEDRVHFGFRDGISQPRIRGVARPDRAAPDNQPPCEPGEFLLGCDYRNQFEGNFLGDLPRALADNASYAAFRVLQQDVWGFQDFLEEQSRRTGLHPDLIAAKMLGRWSNGVPVVLRPGPEAPTDAEEHPLNDFDYVATTDGGLDDRLGARCPVGAHARRMNPRSSPVIGKPRSRRLIRRGMPYGRPLDGAATARDQEERGLVGLFVCGDLEQQFEFVQRVYANQDFAVPGIDGTRDPLIGANDGGEASFSFEHEGRRVRLEGLPRFVNTRGAAYCFVPGIGGLRYLASLQESAR